MAMFQLKKQPISRHDGSHLESWTWEVETGSGVQDMLWLHGKSQATLVYMRPCTHFLFVNQEVICRMTLFQIELRRTTK